MTRTEKKQLACSLYVKSGLTRKMIAKQVGCTEKTLRGWIELEEWDKLKDAQSLTRASLLADAYNQLKAINKEIEEKHNGVPDKKLSDAKGIIRKEIEVLSDAPVHRYIEVMSEFIEHVAKNKPGILHQMIEVTDGFINSISE